MKTVFLNPFLPTDLNEKVTSVSFKIGSFDYIAKHADVKTTEIDFDKRIIQINDALDSTASLRELVRAFFIIVAYELNLNAEFPNGKKAHLDDIAMAHLSFLFTHWWDDSTFDWEYNTDYPKSFKVGSVIYRVYNMTEVSYQSTQGIQYGVSDHVLREEGFCEKTFCHHCCFRRKRTLHSRHLHLHDLPRQPDLRCAGQC